MTRLSIESSLSPDQRDSLVELERLALGLNRRLNLYSEDSSLYFHERHILHSLAIGHRPFPGQAEAVDWGTGGGMPGLPLAIAFPDTTFHLVDSVGKKVKAVETMARRLKLSNVHTYHCRAENWEGKATHSVSRATAPLIKLWTWHTQSMTPGSTSSDGWEPGLICLKGGDLESELASLKNSYPDVDVHFYPLQPILQQPYFQDKMIVTVTRSSPA